MLGLVGIVNVSRRGNGAEIAIPVEAVEIPPRLFTQAGEQDTSATIACFAFVPSFFGSACAEALGGTRRVIGALSQ